MKKTYCDLCQSEMDDWNDMFTLSYKGDGIGTEVVGMISARSRVVYDKNSIWGYTDTPIDICKECLIKLLREGTIERVPPPVV